MKLAIFLCHIFLILPTLLSATTWYVDDDGTYPGSGTPGDPFVYIQDAIDVASNGDTILVFPGHYYDIYIQDKDIILRSDEDGVENTHDITPETTFIQMGISFYNTEGPASTIEGFTINYGYGINCDNASSHILNNIIKDCDENGGIQCWNSNVLISGNTIENNFAELGGGIYVSGGSPTIKDNIIDSNRAHFGGGVYIEETDGAIIQGNLIYDNNASYWGAGISLQYSNSLIIRDNFIESNFSFFEGGGIFCSDDVTNTEIVGNEIRFNVSLHGNGAGICCLHDASPTIKNNRIVGNQALYGNGGGIDVSHFSNPKIFNNLILRNFAYNHGGGIECYFHSSPTVTNNTIYWNQASFGGGVYCEWYSSPAILNTIVWNNEASLSSEEGIAFDAMSSPSVDFCDVEGGWMGKGNLDIYPEFGPGSDGGFYLNQVQSPIQDKSPCIDAGNGTSADLGLDTFWTSKDKNPDVGIVDIGFHFGPFSDPWGTIDVEDNEIYPNDAGGRSNLYLDVGPWAAFRTYYILGGVSGTSPGIVLPGGKPILPINYDLFTEIVIANMNTPMFKNFHGQLDEHGYGKACFDVGPFPLAFPVTINFAFALSEPWDFASNPVEVYLRMGY